MHRSHEHEFPKPLKREIREIQQSRCLYCQGLCRGHNYGEPTLQIHHVVPVSVGGAPVRENAVGLCDHTGENCHHRFDRLYFDEQKTVIEVLMEEGRWFQLQDHPANPYTRSRNQVGD